MSLTASFVIAVIILARIFMKKAPKVISYVLWAVAGFRLVSPFSFEHVVKIAAFFILCVHWFNPLVWLAFVLMSADMEMSCDERVLKEMGDGIKKAYSTLLLSLASRVIYPNLLSHFSF